MILESTQKSRVGQKNTFTPLRVKFNLKEN